MILGKYLDPKAAINHTKLSTKFVLGVILTISVELNQG